MTSPFPKIKTFAERNPFQPLEAFLKKTSQQLLKQLSENELQYVFDQWKIRMGRYESHSREQLMHLP